MLSASNARLHASIVALVAATSGAACGGDTTFDTATTVPTAIIAIEPTSFLGQVPCSNLDGALRSYVVTVIDMTVPAMVIALPSSTPVPCSRAASFRLAAPDHEYVAEIDGYDVPADQLVPLGGAGSGSRRMQRKGSADVVTPRFTSECGRIEATSVETEKFKACAPLIDMGSSPATSVRVDPRRSLFNLRCAGEGGEVGSFDVMPVDAPLPAVNGLACGAAPILYSAGITPDRAYTFRILARAGKDGEVVWGSSCVALPKKDFVTTAVCDPLSSTGAVTINLGEIIAKAGLVCGKDVATYDASLPGAALSIGPVHCGANARFSPLDPGVYDVDIRAFGADGAQKLQAKCEATVGPGDSAPVTCPAFP